MLRLLGSLAERDEATAGDPYSFYFTDHLGSTMALYDASKGRTGGIEYTAYGAILSESGTASDVTRRYTGQSYDPITGDYFAPYRYYSPNMHRWLTRDPLGIVDGPNVYGYVGGGVTFLKDPTGMWDTPRQDLNCLRSACRNGVNEWYKQCNANARFVADTAHQALETRFQNVAAEIEADYDERVF